MRPDKEASRTQRVWTRTTVRSRNAPRRLSSCLRSRLAAHSTRTLKTSLPAAPLAKLQRYKPRAIHRPLPASSGRWAQNPARHRCRQRTSTARWAGLWRQRKRGSRTTRRCSWQASRRGGSRTGRGTRCWPPRAQRRRTKALPPSTIRHHILAAEEAIRDWSLRLDRVAGQLDEASPHLSLLQIATS